jgi:hypothetical protein
MMVASYARCCIASIGSAELFPYCFQMNFDSTIRKWRTLSYLRCFFCGFSDISGLGGGFLFFRFRKPEGKWSRDGALSDDTCEARHYLITRSARASTLGGTFRF